MKYYGHCILIALMLAACSAPVVQAEGPALVTNPGPESLGEIEQAVSAAMGGAGVTLAEDVLTDSSVLVIERGLQRGFGRTPELGRDLGRPYRFQLVKDGSECLLVDQQSGRRWPLPAVECREEEE